MDKYIGKLLGGRYEIIDVVGVGGMAMVYRARCHVLNRYVAVKILKDEFAKDPDIRRRFSIESQAVAKLSHHNIVSVYDVGCDNGVDYIVMELMEGVTLKEYLQKKGSLSWQESLFFAQQIARALVHAHSRGIIHQDIKPQNVIILRDGTAKLTDFGIASFATTQETKVVQEAIGSVHYISPEQAKGSSIDYRTDIYSLGVVMYEMVTGKLPFEGETAIQVVMQHLNAVPLPPSELAPDVPHGFDEIIMHAMCANINKRYASAEELYTDLERLKSDVDAVFHYDAGCGDGETQVLGHDVVEAARRTPVAPDRDRAVQSRRAAVETREPETFFERLGERPALAATVAVIVFAVIALVVAGALILTGNKGEKISVPPFVGNYFDDVMKNTEWTENFNIKEAEKRVESSQPVGMVLEQSVEAYSKVTKGTNIVLTVSAGGPEADNSYSITDFKGKTMEYVETILNRHNVSFTTATEYSEELEKDLVIRTEPAAGQKLAEGETLTVYISLGKEVKQVAVPNLYGQSVSKAEKTLNEVNLARGGITQIESDQPQGTVVGQTPKAGEKLDEGKAVDIQISSGKAVTQPEPGEPDTPDEPDPGNGENGGDEPEPEPTEPTVGTARIPVVMPPDTESAQVTITLDGQTLYDQTVSSASGSVAVTVSGPAGTHEVQVSVGGGTPQPYTATFNP